MKQYASSHGGTRHSNYDKLTSEWCVVGENNDEMS